MSSSYYPIPVEMDSDLHQQVEADQNLDQLSLINLINLDSSDSSSIAHLSESQPHPFALHLSSIDGSDYYHHQSNLNPAQTDPIDLVNNLEYAFQLDNPLNLPPATIAASSSGPYSSPSWSPLDQLLFPSLTHPLQSSPLFPLELLPNCQESTADLNKEPELNLIDFSAPLDSQLQDWSLIFDSIQANQESNHYDLAQLLQSSGSKGSEPGQKTPLPVLQPEPSRATVEHFLEFNRSTIDIDGFESGLYPVSSDATEFTSPISPEIHCYPLPMKRKRSTNAPTLQPDLVPFDPLEMCLINSSIDQHQEVEKEKGNLKSIENHVSHKRSKTGASRSASKPKIHVCNECGKSFPRLTSLTQHKLTHNGERPFRCSFEGCNKSFTTSSNSKRHWRTHF